MEGRYSKSLARKKKKNVCSNYRPVSLTSVVCKLLESLLRDVLLKYSESNNKIVSNQYGFRPGYSCCSQLLNVMEDFQILWTHLWILIVFIWILLKHLIVYHIQN